MGSPPPTSPNLPTPAFPRGGAEAAATVSVAEPLARYKSETHWRQDGREQTGQGWGPLSPEPSRPSCLPSQHKVSGLPPDCLFVSEMRKAKEAADRDHGGHRRRGQQKALAFPRPPPPPWNSWSAAEESCLLSLPPPQIPNRCAVRFFLSLLGETKEIQNGTLETLLSGEPKYTEGMKGRYRKDFRRCR